MANGRRPGRMRYSWESRCRIVAAIEAGASPAEAAAAAGASRATGYRLWRRFQEGGWSALLDRPPIARHCPHRLSVEAEAQIVELRRRTGWGPLRLAAVLGRRPSTVYRVLVRAGVSRRAALPRPEVRRYEHDTPGALIHLDTKKLGRFWQPGKRALGVEAGTRNRQAGWQHLHVMVDDHARLAHAVLLPSDRGDDCAKALELHLGWLQDRGIHAHALLTDNGTGYRSHTFKAAVERLGIRHRRTRPRRPQTNGKAEAFIGIALREWAYGHVWRSSAARAYALDGWLRWYNNRRPHGTLGAPPISRVAQAPNYYS